MAPPYPVPPDTGKPYLVRPYLAGSYLVLVPLAVPPHRGRAFRRWCTPVSYTHLDVYKRQFDGRVFQNPLYGFKIAAADNRLMHIFCDVPLAPVYIVVMFIPEMLCGLEVDHNAAILLPCEMCIRDRACTLCSSSRIQLACAASSCVPRRFSFPPGLNRLYH